MYIWDLNGVLVPHIDDMEVSLRRLADDEATTVGSTRELVQKALKIVAENSFFYKDLEVRDHVMLMNCVRFVLQSAGLTTIDDHSLDDSGQDLRYRTLLYIVISYYCCVQFL